MDFSSAIAYNKANSTKRLLNYIIDIVVFMVILLLMTMIILLINPNTSIFYDIESSPPILFELFYLFLYGLIMFLSEYLTKGRSVGKYITGTQVVRDDGLALTPSDFLKRNSIRLLPFEVLSFLGNSGWHDKFSKTTVVNKKGYENDIQITDDIELLGKA